MSPDRRGPIIVVVILNKNEEKFYNIINILLCDNILLNSIARSAASLAYNRFLLFIHLTLTCMHTNTLY